MPAKVNLALRVGGTDEQGYHALGTVFQAVSLGDEVTAEVEVIAMRDDKPIATLATRILTQGGALAVTGDAVVKLP